MSANRPIIEAAFERRAEITPRSVETLVRDAVLDTIERLDRGEIRVAEKRDGAWVVNDWIKKAVLLSFRIEDNSFMKGGFTNYYDKVPSKYQDYNSRDFRDGGVRVVPPATARRDELTKFQLYRDEGVSWYVLVYPSAAKAKVYRLVEGDYRKVGDFHDERHTFALSR